MELCSIFVGMVWYLGISLPVCSSGLGFAKQEVDFVSCLGEEKYSFGIRFRAILEPPFFQRKAVAFIRDGSSVQETAMQNSGFDHMAGEGACSGRMRCRCVKASIHR